MVSEDAGRQTGPVATEGAPSISVSVKLFADLRKYLPKDRGDPFRLTLPAGATVATLVEMLGIPADYELTAGVNDELAQRETVLQDGDSVMLLSPMEGG